MKTIYPDPYFDWVGLIKTGPPRQRHLATKKATSKEGVSQRKEAITNISKNIVIPLNFHLMSSLGVQMLHNRRVCFAGAILRGIILPKDKVLQEAIIKRFLAWYLPCLEFEDNAYKLNKVCFRRRENYYLKMFLISLGYRHFAWSPA